MHTREKKQTSLTQKDALFLLCSHDSDAYFEMVQILNVVWFGDEYAPRVHHGIVLFGV